MKYDPLNIDLFRVYLELGRWLNWRAMKEAKGGTKSEKAEQFLQDGRTLYLRLVEEIHSGAKRTGKEQAQMEKWIEFSRQSREKIGSYAESQEISNPLDLEPPSPQQVRAWVDEGTLPSMK